MKKRNLFLLILKQVMKSLKNCKIKKSQDGKISRKPKKEKLGTNGQTKIDQLI